MTDRAYIDLPTGVHTAIETAVLESGVTVQVCRTSVRRDDRPSTQVILVLDVQGLVLPTEADLLNLLATSLFLGTVAGLQTTDSGKVKVITLPEFDGAPEDIALAAAVCAASWGWDESELIRVTVNDRAWDVTPAFRDGAWTATLA